MTGSSSSSTVTVNEHDAECVPVKGSEVPSVQLGPVPELVDFEPYISSVSSAWDEYVKAERVRSRCTPEGQVEEANDSAPAVG